MIVNHIKEGWEIVSHYAHGLLAGKFAMHLDRNHLPTFWTDTITAVVEHDDHLLDFEERDYLTEHGTPLDFTMAKGTKEQTLEHARRVYSKALQKSQFIGLLVGRHLEFLYDGLSQQYNPMKEFLKEITSLRNFQRKLYGIKKSDENNLYDVLRFCDRCSLILAQKKVPEIGRMLEINNTIKGETYFLYQNSDSTYSIEPWPFEEKEFELSMEFRILEQTTFKNNRELQNVMGESKIDLRKFRFKRN